LDIEIIILFGNVILYYQLDYRISWRIMSDLKHFNLYTKLFCSNTGAGGDIIRVILLMAMFTLLKLVSELLYNLYRIVFIKIPDVYRTH